MKTVAECGIIEILAFSRQLKLHGALPDIIRGNQASQNLETELCRISSSVHLAENKLTLETSQQ